MEWILSNKEWLFSGVAIAIPLAVLGWILSGKNNRQNQKGGDSSTNIQVGGNLSVGRDEDDK